MGSECSGTPESRFPCKWWYLLGCEVFLKRRLLLINYSLCSYRTDKAPKFHILHTWMVLDLIPLQSGTILQWCCPPQKEDWFPGGWGGAEGSNLHWGSKVEEVERESRSQGPYINWGSEHRAAFPPFLWHGRNWGWGKGGSLYSLLFTFLNWEGSDG